MVKLDFDLERDVPELKDKVILITGGRLASHSVELSFGVLTLLIS